MPKILTFVQHLRLTDSVGFDRIAPLYDRLSRVVFGESLQRAQTVFLTRIRPDAHVLIVGGGTGMLLNHVLTTCKPASVLYLEASAKMLDMARRRVQHQPLAHRVTFRHGTQSDLRPGELFTVVMLPFVLDLFPESVLTNQILPPLVKATAPDGRWLVTDFVNSPRWAHRLILNAMYQFFRLVSGIRATHLPDLNRLLTEAGLTPGEQRIMVGGQVQTGWWRALG